MKESSGRDGRKNDARMAEVWKKGEKMGRKREMKEEERTGGSMEEQKHVRRVKEGREERMMIVKDK